LPRNAVSKPIPEDRAKWIFAQIAVAVKELHDANVVHRDIKPDNILVHNGKLKITDFGLSKYATDSTRTLTLKGYGTLEYVAPEAWESDKNTVQMDIYSMGIVFYQIATLQYPYKLPAYSDVNTYRDAHLYHRVQNPTIYNPSLPQGLVSIILRMLEKPTQKRFSNWEEIIEALGKNATPASTSNTALERALANRNNADLRKQEEAATRKKAETMREQQCKLVSSQYEVVLYEPIRAFISSFNEQYAGTTGFHFEDKHRNSISDHFSVKITTPDKKWICIDTEVVFAENHHRSIRTSSSLNQFCISSQNYIPQCKGRDVMAWSYLRDETGRGFNILLLKRKDSLYGDWYILRNTNGAFSREYRAEPFGFTLQELPKEIVHIDALHIYNSEFKDFEIADVENFLADRA
jgi:serine/threonine protein kinase